MALWRRRPADEPDEGPGDGQEDGRRPPDPRWAGESWDEHRSMVSLVAAIDTVGDPDLTLDREAAARWAGALLARSPQQIGSALVLLVRCCVDGRLPRALYQLLPSERDPWTVSRAGALLAAEVALDLPNSVYSRWALETVFTMLERTSHPEVAPEPEALELTRRLIARVDAMDELRGYGLTLRAKLLEMLPRAGTQVATARIAAVDGWSAGVLPELAMTPAGDIAPINALLEVLATATGSRPSARWLAEVGRVLDAPAALAVIRLFLTRLADAEGIPHEAYGLTADSSGPTLVQLVVAVQNADLVRAAAWAGAATPPADHDWVVPALHAAARRSIARTSEFFESELPANACIFALGQIGTPAAIQALLALHDGTRHRGVRKLIWSALERAAAAAGLTPGQLAERTVATAGLGADGSVEIASGPVVGRVGLDDDLRVVVQWRGPSGWQRQAPSGATDDLAPVKQRARELRALVALERRRLEGLCATERNWPFAEWQQHYLDHPITGRLTRRLIWRFQPSDGGAPSVGLPLGDGMLATLGGSTPLRPSDDALVELWHPAGAEAEVSPWRNWMLAHAVAQPFPQAFREVCARTSTEAADATYSARFAAHVLRYPLFYALAKERGWATNYLGPYDGGGPGRATLEVPESMLVVVLEHDAADLEEQYPVQLATTGRVWFHRAGDRLRRAMALGDVPPLVFSEAMRDVDLFVSVASIATDPTWADRPGDPHFGYWSDAAAAELGARAEVRRVSLAHVLPTLPFGSRVRLEARHVRVLGATGDHTVHIGTALVRTEPSLDHVVVEPMSKGLPKLPVPCRDDPVLVQILGTVNALLARD